MPDNKNPASPSLFPLLLLGLFVLFGLIQSGVWVALAVVGAFAVGRSSVHSNSPFFHSLEQKQASARDLLGRLPEADVTRIETIVSKGRRIEAIKEIRSINQGGLMEAKNATDLLAERGMAWRDKEGAS